MNKAPCYNCKNRLVGCHSTCLTYKDFTEYKKSIARKRKEYLKNNYEEFIRSGAHECKICIYK